MNLNNALSAGLVIILVGLLVLHPQGATQNIEAAGGVLTNLIKVGQAQGVAGTG